MMMPYQARLYLQGAFGAAINGAANSIVVMIADPSTFNIYEGWKKLCTVTLVSAIVGFALYVKTHPLPDPDKDSNYIQVSREAISKIQGTGNGAVTPPKE